ncbi:hypothetical protein CB0940_08755 [Cercospora beticola]|uniref:Uncharacterized protein n=1 Tax=Cercospora beticola TaxID=122368 RepID=A0A2G5HQ21_CERBT|nr:hypothetical protein CB0940_08755 [Cercospora beticola]PIA94322.1 hypothetical protein CB0940_08755 [Cercospora beticola]WPB05338.1 hypothetical protein RHO25_009990 [Cercospora beticola]
MSTAGQSVTSTEGPSNLSAQRSASDATSYSTPQSEGFRGLEEVRKMSRANFCNTSFRNGFQDIAFSSYVKRALDHPEARTSHVKDVNLREFLVKKTIQESRTLKSDPEYDALHFDIPPTPHIAPAGYDEIHLRNVFNHDIAFAALKHTRAEKLIEDHGLVIEYSVADAHFLTIFGHLRTPSHDPALLEGISSNTSYEVYHDLRNGVDIETQFLHLGIEGHLDLGAEIPEYDLPHVEALHDVYKRPYLVRRIEDLNFIKAWESLTKSDCMMWYARDLKADKSVWVTVSFHDAIRKGDDGDRLGFTMDLNTVTLPYHCDLDGVRREEAIEAHREFERMKAEREAKEQKALERAAKLDAKLKVELDRVEKRKARVAEKKKAKEEREAEAATKQQTKHEQSSIPPATKKRKVEDEREVPAAKDQKSEHEQSLDSLAAKKRKAEDQQDAQAAKKRKTEHEHEHEQSPDTPSAKKRKAEDEQEPQTAKKQKTEHESSSGTHAGTKRKAQDHEIAQALKKQRTENRHSPSAQVVPGRPQSQQSALKQPSME